MDMCNEVLVRWRKVNTDWFVRKGKRGWRLGGGEVDEEEGEGVWRELREGGVDKTRGGLE